MVYTVGHSNHTLERFVDLLKRFEIAEVVDVRSAPVSAYAPHFNKVVLQNELPKCEVSYLFMGDELGGRPDRLEFYDSSGFVLYGKLSKSFSFNQGIDRLVSESERSRIAIMCSEEDPSTCHRHLLIARVLSERQVHVLHIRGDGSGMTYEQLVEEIRTAKPGLDQVDLFASKEEDSWKSTRSVLRENQRSHFLDY